MSDVEAKKGDRNVFLEEAKSAFDLASGGMGIHAAAVEQLFDGKDLPDWAKQSIGTSGSNFLVNPYVMGWRDSGRYEKFAPKSLSLYSDHHLKIIQLMREEYNSIDNQKTRYIFGGENGLTMTDNPSLPIGNDEASDYLGLAVERGVIDLPEGSDLSEVAGDINDHILNFGIALKRIGAKLTDKLYETYEEMSKSGLFDTQIRHAAIYKLAAMLALADQLSYDASQQGAPIPADFKPKDPDGRWNESWVRLFGVEMPTFEGLYQYAHSVFVKVADSSDPILTHLFPMTHLPQLAD